MYSAAQIKRWLGFAL